MAKAIKHTIAGMYHEEIIGKIPERPAGKKSRGARVKPTSPAQLFFNAKLTWRECMLMLATNFGRRDWVVTLTYDDAHLPLDKVAARKFLQQKYFLKLRQVRRRRGEELKYIYTTEGFHGKQHGSVLDEDGYLEDCRFHHHLVINDTGPETLEEIRSLWPGGGYVRIEALDIHYYKELAKYLTKEAREFGRAKTGERTWNGSRNLTKYEVEYIEIPSDSVTLAPPEGAVDYTTFHDKNPYGFADLVGATYLLFPAKANPLYSYNQGRGNPPNN